MSSQNGRQQIFIPGDFGSPAQYDSTLFPMRKIKGGSLHDVDMVLIATMDEILKMKSLARNRSELRQLLLEAKDEYDT